MGVNSLPKTVTRQRRGCDLNSVPSAPESSTLTTLLPSRVVSDTDTVEESRIVRKYLTISRTLSKRLCTRSNTLNI